MIYDRNPLFTQLADKLAVREYVSRRIGEQYLVTILAAYDSENDINIDKLPERFVLKCNHDSGSSIICQDKAQFDLQKAKDKLSSHLMKNLYYITRERHYKNIMAKIICEQYIDLSSNRQVDLSPETCRIHCFSGKPMYAEINFIDSQGSLYANIYDVDWVQQPIVVDFPNTPQPVKEPHLYKEMLQLAQNLTSPFDYCRADFLMSNDRLYFSEMTFTPNAGRLPISPLSWDFRLGELWDQRIVPERGRSKIGEALVKD